MEYLFIFLCILIYFGVTFVPFFCPKGAICISEIFEKVIFSLASGKKTVFLILFMKTFKIPFLFSVFVISAMILNGRQMGAINESKKPLVLSVPKIFQVKSDNASWVIDETISCVVNNATSWVRNRCSKIKIVRDKSC